MPNAAKCAANYTVNLEVYIFHFMLNVLSPNINPYNIELSAN